VRAKFCCADVTCGCRRPVGVFFPWRLEGARGAPSIAMDIDDQPGASSPLKSASSPASPAHDCPVKKQTPRTRSRRGPAGASGKQQHPQSQLLARRGPGQQQLRHPQGSARGASEQHPRNQLIGAWRREVPQGGRDVHEDRRGAAASPAPTSTVDLGSRLREAREAAVDGGDSPMWRSVSFGPVSGRSAQPKLASRANTAPRAARAKPLAERRSAGRPAGKGDKSRNTATEMLADKQYINIDQAATRHCTERTPDRINLWKHGVMQQSRRIAQARMG
jgi:hypothetical protein